MMNNGLLELQAEGKKLEAEVKEVTDEGMRQELSYQRALEDMAMHVVHKSGDLFGVRQQRVDDLKQWHLHKNGMLMDPRIMGKINTEAGVDELVEIAKKRAQDGNTFLPAALAPIKIDAELIHKITNNATFSPT